MSLASWWGGQAALDWVPGHNKKFKQTKNAWHFWFALSLVFTVVCRNDVCTFLAA
ncbi:TPA: DUF3265 domain-containing protein [Vibrio parahaemolyticus]|nr:DUF3265 domain-containing protein [Vibrio parahaemolyticus]